MGGSETGGVARSTPYTKAVSIANVPPELKKLLPGKWEMIGKVVILKLRKELEPFDDQVGEAYAEALGADSVFAVDGMISGTYRRPALHRIYGHNGETVHHENGVNYVIDVSTVMFSSSNHDERIRMAGLDCDGETIVDMFAGIGHLSMPIAVHSAPAKIVASEASEATYRYLLKTIEANGVQDVYDALNIDNRLLDVKGADRVIMGYLMNTGEWLGHAISMCRKGATIHMHEAVRRNALSEWKETLTAHYGGGRVTISSVRKVKGYSALFDHMVADLTVC